MQFSDIDNGKTFDWGNTSKDYAKYRDIYPDEFYQFILDLGLCKDGQKVLGVGTGTGVLPRNMYRYGAKWMYLIDLNCKLKVNLVREIE